MTEEFPTRAERLDQEVIIAPAQQFALEALRLKKTQDNLRGDIRNIETNLPYPRDEEAREVRKGALDELRSQVGDLENEADSAYHQAYDEDMGEEGEKYRSGLLSDDDIAAYEKKRRDATITFFGTYDQTKIGLAIRQAETGKTPLFIRHGNLEEEFAKKHPAQSAQQTTEVSEDQEITLSLEKRQIRGVELLERGLLIFAASRGNLYAKENELFGTGADAESVDFYKQARAMSPDERDEAAEDNIKQAAEFYNDLTKEQGLINKDVREKVGVAIIKDHNRRLDEILWEAMDSLYGINGTDVASDWLNKSLRPFLRRHKGMPDPLF